MYVCLCNGYRDAEIREIAESVHAPAAQATPRRSPRRPEPEMAPEAAEALLMAAE
jgi:hypothetical protein